MNTYVIVMMVILYLMHGAVFCKLMIESSDENHNLDFTCVAIIIVLWPIMSVALFISFVIDGFKG